MLANKTLLQMKYARIVEHLSYEDALDFFYHSYTYTLVSQGIADMHCRSDEYLAEELLAEWQETNKQQTTH